MTLKAAAAALGVSQPTVLQRLKSGQLEGVRVRTGRRTAWRIRLLSTVTTISGPSSTLLEGGKAIAYHHTGVDLVALLESFAVSVHAPNVEVARRVVSLAAWPEVSLAHRFAAATAQHLRARLYTTDGVLATGARRHGLACAHF